MNSLTVLDWFEQLGRRAGALRPAGFGMLVECSDPQALTTLTRHKKLQKLCLQAGERHLVVFPGQEAGFRREARALGYVLPQD